MIKRIMAFGVAIIMVLIYSSFCSVTVIGIDTIKTSANEIIFDDTDPKIEYAGFEILSGRSEFYQSACRFSDLAGTTVSFKFKGTAIKWIGSNAPDHGKAQVYIDNRLDRTVDTYAAFSKYQEVCYEKKGLSAGNHNIKVVVLHEKSEDSKGYFQDVDAIVIANYAKSDGEPVDTGESNQPEESGEAYTPAVNKGTALYDTYSDTWAANDGLERKVSDYETAGALKAGRTVGIFYSIWQHDVMQPTLSVDPNAPRNIASILANNKDALTNSSVWGPDISMHYSYEPLFGYYDMQFDEYVLRRHAQMLSDAGVDTLVIDFTNYFASGFHNVSAYPFKTLLKLCEVFTKVRNEGGKTPGILLLCTWSGNNSASAITQFYNVFYSKGLYKDLWFQWQGKPMILGDKTEIKNQKILDFFTFRQPAPELSAPDILNYWPWLSVYPQQPSFTKTNYKESLVAGVAQNWFNGLSFFSSINANGQFVSRGRSYHNGSDILSTDPVSNEYPTQYGYNLKEQIDRAINIDPSFLLFTQWNEQIAAKFPVAPTWLTLNSTFPPIGGFADQFTPEFSRDIEPTRDERISDNYYYQLVDAIRRYKGVRPAPAAVGAKKVDLANLDQWTSIGPEYRDDLYDTSDRDSQGISEKVRYVNKTTRNNFVLSKVSYDNDNIYFYIETKDNISPYTDPHWMQLLIKTGDGQNWEGYNYILSRTGVSDGKTTLEQSRGGWNWKIISDNIEYKTSGNKMAISIPRNDLGLKGKTVDIEFKWNDNMQAENDVLDFYINGDTAPNGRFNYVYSQSANSAIPLPMVKLFDENTERSPLALSKGDKAGLRYKSDSAVNQVDVCATGFKNDAGSMTISLYNWAGSVSKTMKGKVIARQKFDNFADNTWLTLKFGKQPPGIYYIAVSDTDKFVGLYSFDCKTADVQSYYNGKKMQGIFAVRIGNTDTEKITVGKVTASSNSNDAGKLLSDKVWTSKESDVPAGEEWLELDLGKEQSVARIGLTPYILENITYGFMSDFKIQYSIDGKSFSDVPNQTYTNYPTPVNGVQYLNFDTAIRARMLRIVVSGMTKVQSGKYAVKLGGVEILRFGKSTILYRIIWIFGILILVLIAIAATVLIRRKKGLRKRDGTMDKNLSKDSVDQPVKIR